VSETCPKSGCDFSGKNRLSVGVHFSQNHEGLPPWKKEKDQVECPKDGCNYTSKNRMGLGVHWSKIGHSGLPPWKSQTCDLCGTKFARCDSQTTDGKSYCSEECYGKTLEGITGEDHSSWKEKVILTCDECGCNYKAYPSDVDRYPHNFCNYDCFVEWETSAEETLSYGPNWEEIAESVRERDDHTCTYEGCNRTECSDGRKLHVHHIIPLREFENHEQANDKDNLRTLCDEHHRRVEVESRGQ